MGTVISNLKARFGVDTSDFKSGLKDGERAVSDFKGAAGDTLQKFAAMFGINMGAVNDAIGTASKSLNFMSSALTGAAKGGNVMAIAMKVLKAALISTGIGALVVALGSLIAYFTKSGEGADRFAKILAQLKSVFNNLIERIVQFGGGLADIFTGKFKEGVEQMRTAFRGMGDEIKEDWKAAGQLADAEDALEDREIALITSLEERRAKVAELRLQAKEEQEDNKKKLSYLEEASALTKGVYADQISLETERLRIMKEQLAISAKDPTDDQRRAVAEQEAKINSLLREQATELRGISREKNTVIKAVEQEVALEKEKAANTAITVKTIESIKLPDLSQTVNAKVIVPMQKVAESVKAVTLDLTSTINQTFDNLAVGMGEFLGNLMVGEAGIGDFGRMVASTFADMAIQVGKIAIATGLATLGIKAALETLNPAVAIAAGVALVALGTAVKGALSNVASGGSASSTSVAAAGSSFTYDNRTPAGAAANKFEISGKLTAEGSDLVYVFNKENTRRKATT